MKFSDIVILAKAGYSPKDVKELFELTETSEKVKETDITTVEPETAKAKESANPNNINAFEELIKKEKEGN